jgi:hypothetical protein
MSEGKESFVSKKRGTPEVMTDVCYPTSTRGRFFNALDGAPELQRIQKTALVTRASEPHLQRTLAP